MEKNAETTETAAGTRQVNLKKSFMLALRSILTACSTTEFLKAFPSFTDAEHERLYCLYIQVVSSLHQNIEDEFESLCLETQAGTTLDTVEDLVEEHNMDPLCTTRSNIKEVGQSLSEAKKNEIYYLTRMLEMAEEQKRALSARLQLLRTDSQEFTGAADIADKLRAGILNYGVGNKTEASNA